LSSLKGYNDDSISEHLMILARSFYEIEEDGIRAHLRHREPSCVTFTIQHIMGENPAQQLSHVGMGHAPVDNVTGSSQLNEWDDKTAMKGKRPEAENEKQADEVHQLYETQHTDEESRTNEESQADQGSQADSDSQASEENQADEGQQTQNEQAAEEESQADEDQQTQNDQATEERLQLQMYERLAQFGFQNDQIEVILRKEDQNAHKDRQEYDIHPNESKVDAEMRRRLARFGFQDNQIEAILNPKNAELRRPTYMKIHKNHIDIETLDYFGLPYEDDRVNFGECQLWLK